MKKTLIVAALLGAAFTMSAAPGFAAEMKHVTKTGVSAECFVLPLLPDCTQAWSDEWKAHGVHAAPLPFAWWTCKPAEEGAKHLFDCDTDA